jgi:hypothetical protein
MSPANAASSPGPPAIGRLAPIVASTGSRPIYFRCRGGGQFANPHHAHVRRVQPHAAASIALIRARYRNAPACCSAGESRASHRRRSR